MHSPRREYPRSARVAVQLQRELDALIREELSDPVTQGVTVTTVDLSPDLRNARVYISRLGQPVDDTREHLQQAAGRLRGLLGKRLRLRRVPVLEFVVDELPDRADKMNRLIREARARDRDEGEDA